MYYQWHIREFNVNVNKLADYYPMLRNNNNNNSILSLLT